jgi:hypothetical protein
MAWQGNAAVGPLGGAGDSPAPVGDPPTGTGTSSRIDRDELASMKLLPFRPVPIHRETVPAGRLGYPKWGGKAVAWPPSFRGRGARKSLADGAMQDDG